VARVARGHVTRPIRIFGALAIAGAAAAVLALGGVPISRAFLAMTAAIALAFAVNRRPTRRPRYPAVQRGAWIAAAAVMIAAFPADAPKRSGGFGFTVSMVDLVLIAAVAAAMLAATMRCVRGLHADPGDRLLIGVLGGIVAFAALFILQLPPLPAAWLYPFAVAIGAGVARAGGNITRP
jgi:hypothetical protein